MFETNFSGHKKIWGEQKEFNWNCPRMPSWLRACIESFVV